MEKEKMSSIADTISLSSNDYLIVDALINAID